MMDEFSGYDLEDVGKVKFDLLIPHEVLQKLKEIKLEVKKREKVKKHRSIDDPWEIS